MRFNLLFVSILPAFILPFGSSQIHCEAVSQPYERALQDITAAQLIGTDEPAHPVKVQKIHFIDGDGALITYSDSKSIVGSILYKPYENNAFAVEAIYKGNDYFVNPWNNYYLSPFDYVTKTEFYRSVRNTYSLNETANSSYCLPNTVKKEKVRRSLLYPVQNYFSIDLSSHVYMYSATYLSETKILNVPNYMNTMYSHQGCVPTTAAMYFSFIDRESPANGSIVDGYLPLNHTDNTQAVNAFITLLGDNYFQTTNQGTPSSNVASGFTSYLHSRGYSSYQAYNFMAYDEYVSIIRDTGNPVPLTINNHHEVLGIGYRILPTNIGVNNFVTANYVYDNSMQQVTFPMSQVTFYTQIHS